MYTRELSLTFIYMYQGLYSDDLYRSTAGDLGSCLEGWSRALFLSHFLKSPSGSCDFNSFVYNRLFSVTSIKTVLGELLEACSGKCSKASNLNHIPCVYFCFRDIHVQYDKSILNQYQFIKQIRFFF